ECARLLTEIKNGTHIDPSRMTVAAFFERWIEHMQGQVSPRSHERYAEIARKNLAPLVGGGALTKVQPTQISEAYAKALASGRRDGKGCYVKRSSRPSVGRYWPATPLTPSSRRRWSASRCRCSIPRPWPI